MTKLLRSLKLGQIRGAPPLLWGEVGQGLSRYTSKTNMVYFFSPATGKIATTRPVLYTHLYLNSAIFQIRDIYSDKSEVFSDLNIGQAA